MLEKKFQFLIGKLKTVLCLREYLRVVLEFQFLIGRLKTGKNLNNSQSGTLNQYDGRKYSVPEMSGNVEQNITLGYFFRRYSDVEKLIEIADRKEVVLYRDKRGRKMYGKITGLSVQDIYQGHIVSITISATDYDEAVGII